MPKVAEVRERLLSDIAAGTFSPGERLTIDDLAARYSASHMPVREVLRELQGSGVLAPGPGRSMHLTGLDVETVSNLFATRSAIEVMLTREAARRCSSEDGAVLRGIEEDLETAVALGDNPGVLAANRRFHSHIYAIADNPEAVLIVERHWLLLSLLWTQVGFGAERYSGVVNDHRHLLTALAANDVEAAGVLMGAHVIKAKFQLLERLSKQAAEPS